MKTLILVVDDNITNLKLASELLEYEKFDVQRASSAEEALRLLKSIIPDLILLDIGLPGMDGFMMTRKLKENPRTKNLLVAALTASAMKGDDSKAYKAGFDGYFTKPINTRIFASQIKEFLNKKNRKNENSHSRR
jgi:CheY-like chemotaxis protein